MLDFPIAPVDAQQFLASTNVTYIWRANPGVWLVAAPLSEATGTGLVVLQTSPELLGDPTSTTPPVGDDDQSIATTEWVNAQQAMVSVKKFGAVGNGIADDQIAIVNAVTACYLSGDTLYWPAGTYLSTANIPNFHSVFHAGPGAVQVGGNLFYVRPTGTTRNILYASVAGDDANDGFHLTGRTRTAQGCIDTWDNYDLMQGRWRVYLLGGAYDSFSITSGLISRFNLEIHGQGVLVAPGYSVAFDIWNATGAFTIGETITCAPSGATATVTAYEAGEITATIVTGTPAEGDTATGGTSLSTALVKSLAAIPLVTITKAGSAKNAVSGHNYLRVELRHIKAIGFSAADEAGFEFTNHSTLELENLHSDTCNYGVNIESFSKYNLNGGVFKNSVDAGVKELFHVVRSWSHLDYGRVVIRGGVNGFRCKEHCTGHIDAAAIVDNEVGIFLNRSCTVNATDALIVRNTKYGVNALTGSFIVVNGIDWGYGTPNANAKNWHFASGSNIVHNSEATIETAYPQGQSESIFGSLPALVAVTGSAGVVQQVGNSLGTLRGGSFTGPGTYVDMEVLFSKTVLGDVTMTLDLSGSNAVNLILPAAMTSGVARMRLWSVGAGNQRAYGTAVGIGGGPVYSSNARTYTIHDTLIREIYLEITLADGGDVMTIHGAWLRGTEALPTHS